MEIIDVMHKPHIGSYNEPRTYRVKANKDYLNIDKKKHKTVQGNTQGRWTTTTDLVIIPRL